MERIESTLEQIMCTVEKIIFQNEDSGYCVISCVETNWNNNNNENCDGDDDFLQPSFTAAGVMPGIKDGTQLKLEGRWMMHKRFGNEFVVTSYEEILPVTKAGIENYLCSGRIKGIGPVLAKGIVKEFGKDTFRIIEEEPEKLLSIKGIGNGKLKKVLESWAAQREVANIMMFLGGLGVSPNLAGKIYAKYGKESIQVTKENPYRLADELWGVGFKTADGIAMALGFEKDCYFRLRSGLLYILSEEASGGSCYVSWDILVKKAQILLGTEDPGEIEITLDDMVGKEDVIKETEDGAVWLPYLYHSEDGCAKRIINLAKTPKQSDFLTENILKQVRSELSVDYNEDQMIAIRTALSENIMVLTGGPGTGKTTTTLGLITAFKQKKEKVLLAAPTGRAAKRLSEATGMKAQTIHRLLEFKSDGTFGKNAEDKLEGDVLVIDECSMVDVVLMNSILKAVPVGMSLILVGDIDQLPSVGPGNVLEDIINSGCVPVIRLTQIFRQAQGSRIIMNAHRICKGEMIEVKNSDADSDFFFSEVKTESGECEEANRIIAARIISFYAKKLPAYYHVKPQLDIQVLAPQKKGLCGTLSLNTFLQDALNPSQMCIKHGDVEYRKNDKVIQLRNNYEKGVFNGDIGIIQEIDVDSRMVGIAYNNDGSDANDSNNSDTDSGSGEKNLVWYTADELDEISLAYAITVHKFQGSECPIVLIPLTMSNYKMLYRKLIYTGVTRGKRLVVLVGEKRALRRAIRNTDMDARNSKLSWRIRQVAEACGFISPLIFAAADAV